MSTNRRIWIPLTAAALLLAAIPAGAEDVKFGAKLAGAAHLPEPIDTRAKGELELVVSADGKRISYELTVADIRNPAAADLHLGRENANGPLVAKLFPTNGAAPKQGEFNGVLVQGTLDAADLVGPLNGATIEDLVLEIRDGNAYVNVHTNDGEDPPDSGPGDYRLGEIRGQIR